jgi:hypothetical protein
LLFFFNFIAVENDNNFFSDILFYYFGHYPFDPFYFDIHSSGFHVLKGTPYVSIELLPLIIRDIVIGVDFTDQFLIEFGE